MKNILRTIWVMLTIVASLKMNAQIPVLNSYPSATATLYLDCDGHTFANTLWNWNGPVTVGGSGMSSAEITEVFNRVAEDYRPFNVNVTTEEAKFLAAPIGNRMRCVLTVDYAWYGISGGVAFVDSWTATDNTPCFVFTSLHTSGGQFVIKNIAEAAAHEAGHTLGLFHQSVWNTSCVKTAEYNAGVGTGEIGWAPIMGNGYYQNMTLWNNGQNSEGCAIIQNDLAIITTGNGFSYRPDDHTNAWNSATVATFSSNQFNVNGVISQITDLDLFKFTQPSFGRFQLNAVPYNVGTGNSGSDLDLQVSLYTNTHTLLGVYNPGNTLSAVIDTLLPSGNYFIQIEGKGNIYAPYYASLGSFSLQGIFTSGNPLPLRRLELRGEIVNEKHKLNWLIDADEQVTQQILEISTDGITFRPLNEPNADARMFLYRPYVNGNALYRMNVTFDNGRQYYSNIVTLRNTSPTVKPQLVSNVISGSQIAVTSPAVYQYTIVDMNGKLIDRGQLSQGANSISAGNITNGMYIIRYSNTAEQWMEKFIRQ